MIILISAILIYSMESSTGLRCPSGIDTFAANRGNNSYYKCIDGIAVLESCDLGTEYNNKLGICEDLSNNYKRGRKFRKGDMFDIIDGDALGRIVGLGTLYDARTSQIYNGFSLWSQKDISENSIKSTRRAYGNTYFFAEKSFSDKANMFQLDAELEMSFMGGLIEVKGSAHYLRDNKKTKEQDRFIMHYKATTGSETIPHALPLTYPKYCGYIGKTTGPTHVVSSVTYGMRAIFVFQSATTKSEMEEEIGGSLEVAVKSIPGFKISGKAVIDVNGKEVKNFNSIDVSFYGDVILDKTPTTYIDAFKALDYINPNRTDSKNDVSRDWKTVIEFQLTPIVSYCDATESIVMAINADLVIRANGVLTDFTELEMHINSLQSRQVSQRFYSIRRTFNTFSNGLKKHSNTFKAALVERLPKLKAGEIGEDELVTLLNNNTDSPFKFNKAEIFLKAREREVNTIELVIKDSIKNPDIDVTDSTEANDNECIFRRDSTTIYNMYVLPAEDVAQQYINGVEESNATKWYNDPAKVGKAGLVFKKFVRLANINKDDNHCFLVLLKLLNPTLTVSISVLNYGRLITNDFDIPDKPTTPYCLENGYDSIRLGMKKLTNVHVEVVEVTFDGLNSDGNVTSSSTRRLANEDNLLIDGLKPSSFYRLQTRYVSISGFSETSNAVECITVLSSSPYTLTVVSDSSSTISLKWGVPTIIAPHVQNQSYIISIYKVGESDNSTGYKHATYPSVDSENITEHNTTSLSKTFINLESATIYNISVVLQYADFTSTAATILHSTAPLPPPQPTIEHVLQNEATVVINLTEVKLAVGMRLKYLGLKYTKSGGTARNRVVDVEGQELVTEFKVELGDLAANETHSVQLKLTVININGFSDTQYNRPTIFKTSYEKSDLEKFKETLGLLDMRNNIIAQNETLVSLEKSVVKTERTCMFSQQFTSSTLRILHMMGKVESLVSRDKAATQSSVYNGRGAGKAVDGVIDPYNSVTCSQTNSAQGNYWRVNLGQKYVITRVVVFNRAANRERLDGAKVYLEKPLGADVYIGTIYAHDEDTYSHEFKWHSRWVANGVKIVQPSNTYLSLCEVQVFGYDA